MRRIALACGAVLVLVGLAVRLRSYLDGSQMHHEMTMPAVPAGPDTVGLLGTLLITQGALLLLAGLFVLHGSHRAAPGAADEPTDTAQAPRPPAGTRQRPSAGRAEESYAGDVTTVDVATIGGGLGSFALVDRLRIAGVATSDLAVVGPTSDPTARFAELCRSSGMLADDRLRSDSSARMDNIWGFPGYAATEARQRHTPVPMLQTLLDPVARPYTPTVGLLVDGVTREAERIGWRSMVTAGEAYRIAARPEGGYLVTVRREGGDDLTIRTRWVHLALGSAGPQLPEVVEASRQRHGTGRVAHVYDPHEEIYQSLRRHGGNVLVRGSGIEASRVLERIIADRDRTGRDVHVWQLFDTYHAVPSGPLTQRHDAGHGFHYQLDAFPRAAYAGQIRDQVRRLDEPERIALIQRLGEPSTPYRSRWAEQLRRGRAEGWYDAVVGEIVDMAPSGAGPEGGVTATVLLGTAERFDIAADHVIDATGLDPTAEHHELVRRLVADGLGELNELGCLRVDESFCVSRSGHGGIVASGITAHGAPLAPVDSFLGLQSAALTIARTLAEDGIGHRLTALRSLRSWWSWMEGAPV